MSLKTKISTPKFEQTKAFYCSLFAMVVAEEWDHADDKGVILEFAGGTRECLLEIYAQESTPDFRDLSLQFKVPSLADFIATVPAGLSFRGPVPRPWGAHYAYFRDPNDIQVIVYEGCL